MEKDFHTPSQADIKKWARLADSSFRREKGMFMAEGVKVVEELLASGWTARAILVMPEKNKYWEKIVAKASPEIPLYALSRRQWQKISQDKEPEGIMALASLPAEPSLFSRIGTSPGNILILQKINNPANLGALLRSALWFGFRNIIMSSGSVDYTNPKTVRSSMGTLFHLNFFPDADLKKVLPEIKKFCYLIGSNVHNGRHPHPVPQKAALLLGSESHGLPDDLLAITDEQWNIPGSGAADSLSLPQAAAIMMYECARK